MKKYFFVSRPRFAIVIAILITLAGVLSLLAIPVAQYPNVTPPTVIVSTSYAGASAQVVADTVASTIENSVNGVEDMVYMESTSSDDGSYSLTVTFESGVDPDIAQVNVQNRVQQVNARLPSEVTQQGVTVSSRSSNMLMAIGFVSPEGSQERVFISNYVSQAVSEAVNRLEGVGDTSVFGAANYSMRIWLNPDRMAGMGVTADEVVAAIQSQNTEATAGSIGSSPTPDQQQLQLSIRSRGRLTEADEFRDIIVRTNEDGAIVRIQDIARVELGSETYSSNTLLDGKPAIVMAVFQSADANALDTASNVLAELEQMRASFPEDIDYQIVFNTTDFVQATIEEIISTLALTFVIVIGVTWIFLQDWRATVVPSLAIPVSLLGTFAVLVLLGYTANTISLFALVLAIGIVVDDAIVVVEKVQSLIVDEGMSPRDAAHHAMAQVTSAVIVTTLVLLSVFVPVGFISGMTGEL